VVGLCCGAGSSHKVQWCNRPSFAPLVALWLLHRNCPQRFRERSKAIEYSNTAPLLLVLAVVGFVIGCPYSVLSFREFWGEGVNGFAYELLSIRAKAAAKFSRTPATAGGIIFLLICLSL
jgi:hypothetical protein